MAAFPILAILAWTATSAEAAASDAYFRPDDANAVIELFEDVGYDVIRADDTIWIRDPNAFAIRMFVYDTPDAPVTAIRFYVQFDIGHSNAAVEQALYYEQTNLMAEVSIFETDGGRQLVLKRDVLLAGGRTPINVVANAQLLFQLTPVFANALADSDPEIIPALQRGLLP